LPELGARLAALALRPERPRFVLDCGRRRLDLGRTRLMGIVNVTPDSFFDGGRFFSPGLAVEQALRLAREGADIIDVGGESTRPGAGGAPAREEWRRVAPVIAGIRERSDVLVSIDTTKAEVARAALDAGADIVNDISGMTFDPAMRRLAARRGAAVVLMHIRGRPRTMQRRPAYRNVVEEILDRLCALAAAARAAGVAENRILIDPGIGFGKTPEHNLEILRRLEDFHSLGMPILVGVSRKSVVGAALGLGAQDRLEGSLAAAVLAARAGAHVLRVHDVEATRRAVCMAEAVWRGLSRNP